MIILTPSQEKRLETEIAVVTNEIVQEIMGKLQSGSGRTIEDYLPFVVTEVNKHIIPLLERLKKEQATTKI